jgi:hypothetical protein
VAMTVGHTPACAGQLSTPCDTSLQPNRLSTDKLPSTTPEEQWTQQTECSTTTAGQQRLLSMLFQGGAVAGTASYASGRTAGHSHMASPCTGPARCELT